MSGFKHSKKKRRHSGRVTPKIVVKGKYSKIIEDALEPRDFWDDWTDYRDGFRGSDDRKHIRKIPSNSLLGKHLNVKRWNKKLKKLIKRRKSVKKTSNQNP